MNNTMITWFLFVSSYLLLAMVCFYVSLKKYIYRSYKRKMKNKLKLHKGGKK